MIAFQNILPGGSEMSSVHFSRLCYSSFAKDCSSTQQLHNLDPEAHSQQIPLAIKTLTGNMQRIHTMNRLGHRRFYSVLEEMDTNLRRLLSEQQATQAQSGSVPVS